jgi:small GTP-binding protein
MTSELELLERLGHQLDDATAGSYPELALRARRVADRLAAGRFHVAVLGEFKRGKSTFINALLAAEVLPTGVLPLTAVATEVLYGEEGATVLKLDGTRLDIGLDEVANYVTEARNPGNEREVERVQVRVPAPLLEAGVVLVDTPGLGSVYQHNTEAGRAALLEADGAIVVLSADSPLSDQERELLNVLSERRARTFIVVNKADHVDAAELESVRRFVTEVVADELGQKPELYCVAARPALTARMAAREPGTDAADFGRFASAFEGFIASDLVDARLAAARHELARVGRELQDELAIRTAALDLDVATLSHRVEEFSTAADRQRKGFEEDRVLLAHETDLLVSELGDRLAAFAAEAPGEWRSTIAAQATSVPTAQLEDRLRESVERSVHEGFEAFRAEESERVEAAWRALAERFRVRTQERVNTVRAAAGELFTIELPSLVVPEVAEERERFFYLFLHVGTSTEGLSRLARRLLPSSVVRKRLLAAALTHLASEFDKHAGRARWDLAQRLEAVRSRFEAAMRAELDGAVESILRAARLADEMRAATQDERTRRSEGDEEVLKIARRAAELR